MNFENIYDLFVSNCLQNNLVFTPVDILNFSNVCNIKPDYSFLKYKLKNAKFDNYNQYKPFLGPVVFCPKNQNLKNNNYNLSKIMLELNLENQNLNSNDKMNKIVNYIKYLN